MQSNNIYLVILEVDEWTFFSASGNNVNPKTQGKDQFCTPYLILNPFLSRMKWEALRLTLMETGSSPFRVKGDMKSGVTENDYI